MYELKKIGKVVTSKFVGTGPSSYKKRIYRTAVSQKLRNTGLYLPRPVKLPPSTHFSILLFSHSLILFTLMMVVITTR